MDILDFVICALIALLGILIVPLSVGALYANHVYRNLDDIRLAVEIENGEILGGDNGLLVAVAPGNFTIRVSILPPAQSLRVVIDRDSSEIDVHVKEDTCGVALYRQEKDAVIVYVKPLACEYYIVAIRLTLKAYPEQTYFLFNTYVGEYNVNSLIILNVTRAPVAGGTTLVSVAPVYAKYEPNILGSLALLTLFIGLVIFFLLAKRLTKSF